MNNLSKFLGKNLLFASGLLVMTSPAIVGCDSRDGEEQGSMDNNSTDDTSDKGDSRDDDDKWDSSDDEDKRDTRDDDNKGDSHDNDDKADSRNDDDKGTYDSDKNNEPDEKQDDDKESEQDNDSDTETNDTFDQAEDSDKIGDTETTAGNDCLDLKSEFDRFSAERFKMLPVSCGGTNVQDDVMASGKLINIPYHLEGFSKISVGCTFSVEVQEGTDFSVVVTVDDNLQQFVNVYQEDDWLIIGANTDEYMVYGITMRAVVTMPTLTELTVSLASSVFVSQDGATDAEVTFNVSHASHLWGCMDVSSLDMDLSGSTYSRLHGTADELQLNAANSVHMDLTNLETQRAKVDIDGSAHVEVAFLESLNGDMSSKGYLCYSGDSSLVNVATNSVMATIEECEPVEQSIQCPWSQPEDLLIDSMDELSTAIRPLSSESIKQDLDCLSELFAKQYVGHYYYDQTGYSLVNEIENYSNSIDAPMTQLELIDNLIMLHHQAYDAHLSYSLEDEMINWATSLPYYFISRLLWDFQIEGGVYVAKNDKDIRILECQDYKPQKALGDNGESIYLFVAQKLDNDVQTDTTECTLEDGTVESFSTGPIYPNSLPEELNRFFFEHTAEDYLYVRVPSMTPNISEEQQKLIDLINNTAPADEMPIIFDLRQNGGGDNTFAYALGGALHSKAEKIPSYNTIDMVSLHNAASSTNREFLEWKRLSGDPIADDYHQEYDYLLAQFNEMSAQGSTLEDHSVETRPDDERIGIREKSWSKPIVLVVDKMCASSCESMIEIYWDHPNTIVIGTHSGGYLKFGNVGAMILPNSKILVYSGWRAFEFPFESPEGLGYEPTYYADSEDLVEVAKQFLLNSRL